MWDIEAAFKRNYRTMVWWGMYDWNLSYTEAQDIASETFYTLFKQHKKTEGGLKVKDEKSFLWVTAFRKFKDYYKSEKCRRKRNALVSPLIEFTSEESTIFSDHAIIIKAIHEEIEKLSPIRKKIFKDILKGKTTEFIAYKNFISPQTVLNQKNNVIKHLQKVLPLKFQNPFI